ncbi:MAG: HNH endonuclease [Ruminococcus sp.]|nr:HNH endonuclease [Ruminococcus sp.]
MLKACQYCGRIHGKKYDCAAKLRTLRERDAIQRERDEIIRSFRSSSAWRKKSEAIRSRDSGLCLICKDEFARFGGKNGALYGTEVHHIVSIANDYDKRLEDDNLITLCRFHHEEAEAGEYSLEYLEKLVSAVSD